MNKSTTSNQKPEDGIHFSLNDVYKRYGSEDSINPLEWVESQDIMNLATAIYDNDVSSEYTTSADDIDAVIIYNHNSIYANRQLTLLYAMTLSVEVSVFVLYNAAYEGNLPEAIMHGDIK